jgi:hypothetical protein
MAGGVLHCFAAPGVADGVGLGLVPPSGSLQAVNRTVDMSSMISILRIITHSSQETTKESIVAELM